MLDRLPLELVQQIVFLTLPSSSSFTKYRERQDPLLALCFTSRALCAVAQPVLFESVNLESDKAVDSFLEVVETNKGLGERVKALRIEGDTKTWYEDGPVVLGRFCEPCKSVAEIVVFQGIVDLCCLEAFPTLDFSTVDAKHWELAVDLVDMLGDRGAMPKLSSVVFPTAFDSHSFQASAPSCSTLQKFEALCASRNIELIFEDLPHPYYDSFISPEFVRRCKAVKAKEAADEVGEGEKE
ncbi:hypothetical protein JCM8097_004203 [Rhodosporidiobolus ruineniae]